MRTLTLPASSSHELILRELRARWHWIVVSTVSAAFGAFLYVFLAPSTVVATTTVNIVAVTSVGAEPSARSAASIIDMPTEIELARSALVAQTAGEKLGDGWSRDALMAGASARGDAGGTIVKISYKGVDAERARKGADALASAYLEERVALVKDRVEQQRSNIDAQIHALESQLASAGESSGPTIRARIDDLVSRRTSLMDPTDKAGQIITSAAEAPTYRSPAPKTVIAAGVFVGMFFGVLLMFVRRAVSNTVTDASDLAELLKLPVWQAASASAHESETGDRMSESLHQTRTLAPFQEEDAGKWAAPVELVLSACPQFPLLMVLDPRSPDANGLLAAMRSAIDHLRGDSDAGFLEIADIEGPEWGVIRAAASSPACVIVVARRSKRSHITQLIDEIDATDCTCLGAFLVETPIRISIDTDPA